MPFHVDVAVKYKARLYTIESYSRKRVDPPRAESKRLYDFATSRALPRAHKSEQSWWSYTLAALEPLPTYLAENALWSFLRFVRLLYFSKLLATSRLQTPRRAKRPVTRCKAPTLAHGNGREMDSLPLQLPAVGP